MRGRGKAQRDGRTLMYIMFATSAVRSSLNSGASCSLIFRRKPWMVSPFWTSILRLD